MLAVCCRPSAEKKKRRGFEGFISPDFDECCNEFATFTFSLTQKVDFK
jgi:hypothetical protein